MSEARALSPEECLLTALDELSDAEIVDESDPLVLTIRFHQLDGALLSFVTQFVRANRDAYVTARTIFGRACRIADRVETKKQLRIAELSMLLPDSG